MVQPWSEFADLDRPDILQFIFYPRRDYSEILGIAGIETCSIQVEDNVSISCRFYFGSTAFPNVLFFHGNGEIASDYEDIGRIFNQIDINLFVADYRGYGSSNGTPTCTHMVQDAHPIFEGFLQMVKEKDFEGKAFIMGRSLGSISAIELAAQYQNQINGLVIESGFVNIFNVFTYIGMPHSSFGVGKEQALTGMERVKCITVPTLVIHGEYDHIVPIEEGKSIYNNVTAEDKRLLIVPGVDHNTVFAGGAQIYLEALREFVSSHS